MCDSDLLIHRRSYQTYYECGFSYLSPSDPVGHILRATLGYAFKAAAIQNNGARSKITCTRSNGSFEVVGVL